MLQSSPGVVDSAADWRRGTAAVWVKAGSALAGSSPLRVAFNATDVAALLAKSDYELSVATAATAT